jgi:hypothetical protein
MRVIRETHRLQTIAQSGFVVLPTHGQWKCAPAGASWLCGARFDQNGFAWTPGRADYEVENRLAAHIRNRHRRLVS